MPSQKIFTYSLLYLKHILNSGKDAKSNETLPDLYTEMTLSNMNTFFYGDTSRYQHNPKKKQLGPYMGKGKLFGEDHVSSGFKCLKDISTQAKEEKDILGRGNNICKGAAFTLRSLPREHKVR